MYRDSVSTNSAPVSFESSARRPGKPESTKSAECSDRALQPSAGAVASDVHREHRGQASEQQALGSRLATDVAPAEELIAAAHAGCFSMALAFLLGDAGHAPESIRTTAQLSFESEQSSWTVTGIHLNVVARVPKIDDAEFREIAEKARVGCLVSRLVVAPVTLEARLD